MVERLPSVHNILSSIASTEKEVGGEGRQDICIVLKYLSTRYSLTVVGETVTLWQRKLAGTLTTGSMLAGVVRAMWTSGAFLRGYLERWSTPICKHPCQECFIQI